MSVEESEAMDRAELDEMMLNWRQVQAMIALLWLISGVVIVAVWGVS